MSSSWPSSPSGEGHTHHLQHSVFESTVEFFQWVSMCPPHSFTSKRAVSPNPYLDNPVNGYACPTGMALHYDDVPINGTVKTQNMEAKAAWHTHTVTLCSLCWLLVTLSPVLYYVSSLLPLLSLLHLLCMLARSNPRTRRRSTPVPTQGGASWKRKCTMRTLTSMKTCPRLSWPLAVLPSLLPPLLPVTTKPLFLKSLPSSSLLMLKIKPVLRWLTPCSFALTLFFSTFTLFCVFPLCVIFIIY